MNDEYQVLLLLSDASGPLPPPADLGDALEHARDWPEARRAVAAARSAFALTDELPSPERLQPLLDRVAAAVRSRACVAVLWQPAARLVPPEALLAAARDEDPLRVALQLRLFHVESGEPEEQIVDTLGLTPLGLPDLQCHFIGLDPTLAGTLIATTARYLCDEGDIIHDGDTLDAPDGTPWSCHREESLLDPPRDVIDLSPPAPHSARRIH